MKSFLSFFLILSFIQFAFADCAGNGLWVFPKSKNILQNTRFVLNAYANSQFIISELNKQHPVYLKSSNQIIKLNVLEICEGQFYLTQAVLVPESNLTAGVEYTFCIEGIGDYESLTRYNPENKKYEPLTYLVSEGVDTQSPVLNSKPKELKKEYIHYGCGPSVHVIFNNPAIDSSEMIIQTTVTNLETHEVIKYYLEPQENELAVGHGMCSGAFQFKEWTKYEIGFVYMDCAGNQTPWTGPNLVFTKPKDTGF